MTPVSNESEESIASFMGVCNALKITWFKFGKVKVSGFFPPLHYMDSPTEVLHLCLN